MPGSESTEQDFRRCREWQPMGSCKPSLLLTVETAWFQQWLFDENNAAACEAGDEVVIRWQIICRNGKFSLARNSLVRKEFP
jgi:hypothetical protein